MDLIFNSKPRTIFAKIFKSGLPSSEIEKFKWGRSEVSIAETQSPVVIYFPVGLSKHVISHLGTSCLVQASHLFQCEKFADVPANFLDSADLVKITMFY